MLLAIDVGNTNIVLGLFEGGTPRGVWRLRTEREATADDLLLKLSGLMRLAGLDVGCVTQAVVACVVPPLRGTVHQLCGRLGVEKPLFIDAATAAMPIIYDNPAEIGADRLVNAVAAWERWHRALLVVDFGTATTLDYVTAEGAYAGGIIAPGVMSAAEALFQKASRLPRADVFLAAPAKVIGADTASCLNSGLVLGFAALVDGLVERARAEVGDLFVVATGGLATVIASEARSIQAVDENLTLEGLRIIHSRAVASGRVF
ncbi:MAG: type III pantothenate kinase [Pseudomonadota bacterium]